MTILTAIVFALAQDPQPLEARVAAYALQLQVDATRDRARDRLVHLGKPALASLEKLGLAPATLESIRQEIALNDSLGSSYGAPHVFSSDGSEESLGVLLSRLETSAGMTFQKHAVDLSQKIAVRLDDATFWEALDEICGKASIRYAPGTEPLYFGSGLTETKPRAHYGSLLIVMDRVLLQRRVTFDKTQSDCTIKLVCQWERTISPLGLTGKYHLTQATDDSGASLLPLEAPLPIPPQRPAIVRSGWQQVDLAGLRPPSPEAKKLARVEGTLELEFPSQVDELRFNTSTEQPPPPCEIPGARVELKSCVRQSNWSVVAEFAIRFQDAAEAAKCRISPTDVLFVVPGDIPRSGYLTARVEKDVFSFSVNCRSGGRQELPKEIRLRIPRGSVIKNMPFCFKDVELK